MHFSIVTVTTFALSLGGAFALPNPQPEPQSVGNSGAPGVHKQSGGEQACCINSASVHTDGLLSGLLAKGVLKNILGSSDQTCAKLTLIENLNLLGFTKQGQNGAGSCSQQKAKCDDEKVSFVPSFPSPLGLGGRRHANGYSAPPTRNSKPPSGCFGKFDFYGSLCCYLKEMLFCKPFWY